MVAKWFRENKWAAAAILLLRLYVGWDWMTHGWQKMTGGFDAGGFLQNAVAKPVADRATQEVLFPTYTWFIEHIALPNVKLINFLIPVGEFLIGLGLIVGGLTLTATFFAMMLNFLFLFAGTVSTNPWLLLIGFIIFLAGANAGRFGLDGLLKPYVKQWWNARGEGRNGAAGGGGWLGRNEARH
ncbi:DoxX family protein [Paenibacillus pasadenensis]|uniref:DoxX family membrane protein n=1 Tax=Paenibacillus pasadenensis TaxID=217090 RepID=UPI002040E573|nr:DoxX family protein [Paenibacillus pasadenensis]MCM3748614.1 DoxX family protein [Paenibacillus pasadenensis]